MPAGAGSLSLLMPPLPACVPGEEKLLCAHGRCWG